MTIDKLIKTWNNLADKERCELLIEHKEKLKSDIKIEIDNDDVYIIILNDANEKVDILDFDEYGYELLNILFQSIGLNSDLV